MFKTCIICLQLDVMKRHYVETGTVGHVDPAGETRQREVVHGSDQPHQDQGHVHAAFLEGCLVPQWMDNLQGE